MALNVISNFAANVAHRNLTVSDERLTRSTAKLSSGLRVREARDDAASLTIGSRLRAEVASLKQASINAGQAGSLLQVADGALNVISDILIRLKALTVQAGSDNLGGNERSSIQLEFSALQGEIDRIARDTEFNGVNLINPAEENVTRVGYANGAEANESLRLIDNRLTAKNGIQSISFNGDFDQTLVQIAYSTGEGVGRFTVTDLSQSVGSSAGRTASATTQLPEAGQGLQTNLKDNETETINVTFDEGGVHERSVEIVIDNLFSKTEFTTSNLDPRATIVATGLNADDVFTVDSYGGNLAGLGERITVDLGTTRPQTILRIANEYGDDLVATSVVDLDSTDEQQVRLQNAQGDFVAITIDLNAAVGAASYAGLQDPESAVASLTISNLTGQGNDLLSGTLVSQNNAVVKENSIADLVIKGKLAIREIGGSQTASAVTASYDAVEGFFAVSVNGSAEARSGSLSGVNGEAGRTTVNVGNRVFEISVSQDFDRNLSIQDAPQIISAAPRGFNETFATGDLEFSLQGVTVAAGETLESLLSSLTGSQVDISGDNDAAADSGNLSLTLGGFSGTIANVDAGTSQTANLTDVNGNILAIQLTNNNAENLQDGVLAVTDDANLDQGETISVNFTGLTNAVFTATGGTLQSSFDVARVSGQVSTLDNYIQIKSGPTNNPLTRAQLVIANSDQARGDLTAEVDLTENGAQEISLQNDVGDSVNIRLNIKQDFSASQLARQTVGSESYLFLGDLGRTALFDEVTVNEREFTFKVGSGYQESDDLTVVFRSANSESLGLSATGPNAIRIDGDDRSRADQASEAVSRAIEDLSDSRAIVGAGQNRLEFSRNNLATSIENAESARSTLLDLDVAAEITYYTSQQVLVQTGISVLAQANQQPQQLLRLFQ